MKQILQVILLFGISFFLYGCPYDSSYNIDMTPQQNIDESLLGSWETFTRKYDDDQHTREEPVKIIFEKRTEMEYDISITGYLDELKPYRVIVNDSIKGTAYLSAAAGRQFLNAYIHGKVYIAEIKKEGSQLSILPLSEYFTSKLIKNSSELRTAVEFHYKVAARPAYDHSFCLKKLQRAN
jgi:hypothetical protein